jgi:hypothetical protein
MSVIKRRRMLGLALATGAALAIPTAAQAQTVSVNASLKAHVKASTTLLNKATKLAAAGKDDLALKAFVQSRLEVARARADVTAILRVATTPKLRVDAAAAIGAVAQLHSVNVVKLLSLVDDVEGKFEKLLTEAAKADTLARNTAVEVLNILMAAVPQAARADVSGMISALVTGRGVDVDAQVQLLVGSDLPASLKAVVTKTLSAGLTGQAQAAAIVAELIPLAPPSARAILVKVFETVRTEQQAAFEALNEILSTAPIPPSVRALVRGIMAQVNALIADLYASVGTHGGTTTPAGGTTPSTGGTSTTSPSIPVPGIGLPGMGGLPDLGHLIPDLGHLIPDVKGLIPDLRTLVPTVKAIPAHLLNGLLGPGGLNPMQLVTGFLGGNFNPFDILHQITGGLTIPVLGTTVGGAANASVTP